MTTKLDRLAELWEGKDGSLGIHIDAIRLTAECMPHLLAIARARTARPLETPTDEALRLISAAHKAKYALLEPVE